jgi:multicomponent Na+:H+ antiporter subunit G
MFALALDSLSWFMLTSGGIFVLIGGIGALRMPDLFTRMHASSLTDSLGPMLILGGLALQTGWSLETLKVLAILIFMLITGPTATYALGNAALMAGMSTRATELEDD